MKKAVPAAKSKGFTLIELLVVIAIIGLLSSVVLASLNSARAKARDAKRQSDLSQIELALREYATSNNGSYPDDSTLSGGGAYDGSANSWSNFLGGLLAPTYIAQIPSDPLPSGSSFYYYAVDSTSFAGSNGGWDEMTSACTGHVVIVVFNMESSTHNRQDCAMTTPYAESIVLE